MKDLKNKVMLRKLKKGGVNRQVCELVKAHGGSSRQVLLDCDNLDDILWMLTCLPGGMTIKRLWACDCAVRLLPLYETAYPGDSRPRDAIAAARRYARCDDVQTANALSAAGRKALFASFDANGTAKEAAEAAFRAASNDAWAKIHVKGSDEWDWQLSQIKAYVRGDVG